MRKGIDDLKSLVLDEPAPFDSTGKYIGTQETEAEYIRRRDAYAERMAEQNDKYIRLLRNRGEYGMDSRLSPPPKSSYLPKYLKGTFKYDNEGQYIWLVNEKNEMQMFAELRGWGAIQQLYKDSVGIINIEAAGKFQDEVGEWLATALNEKLNGKNNW